MPYLYKSIVYVLTPQYKAQIVHIGHTVWIFFTEKEKHCGILIVFYLRNFSKASIIRRIILDNNNFGFNFQRGNLYPGEGRGVDVVVVVLLKTFLSVSLT